MDILNDMEVSKLSAKVFFFFFKWTRPTPLKGYSTQKWKFCHHLLTLKLLQTCMSLFLLLNTGRYFEERLEIGTIDWLP